MTNGSRPSVSDRYRRSAEFDLRAPELRLRQIEWRVLTTLDGQRTVGGVAQSIGIPPAEAIEIIARFEDLGIVETPRMSYEEFRAGMSRAEAAALKLEPLGGRPPGTSPIPPIRPIQPDVTDFDGRAPEQPADGAPALEEPEASPRVTFSLKRAFEAVQPEAAAQPAPESGA